MTGYAPSASFREVRYGQATLFSGRNRPRGSSESPGYDGFRVIKGIVVGCALSLPIWAGIGLALRAAIG